MKKLLLLVKFISEFLNPANLYHSSQYKTVNINAGQVKEFSEIQNNLEVNNVNRLTGKLGLNMMMCKVYETRLFESLRC